MASIIDPGHTYEYFNDDNGKLVCKIEWHDGKIRKETRYDNDIMVYVAQYFYYFAYFDIRESIYENELLVRQITYRNGVKIWEAIYNKGLRDSIYEEHSWFNDGRKCSYTKYENGKLHISWYENGIKRSERVRDASGRISEKQWYNNGQMDVDYNNDGRYLNYVCWHRNGIKKVECVETRDGELVTMTCSNDDKGRDLILPSGEIIVWKKCAIVGNVPVCVKLLVPADSKRVMTQYYSYVEYAQVLEIKDKDGNQYQSCVSVLRRDDKIEYMVGQMVHRNDYQRYGILVYKYQDQISFTHN